MFRVCSGSFGAVHTTITCFRITPPRGPAFLHPLQCRNLAMPHNNVARTGLIDASNDEGLLYFDNLAPLMYSLWDIQHRIASFILRQSTTSTMDFVKEKAVPPDLPIEIEQIIPRAKDGGAIVKFRKKGQITNDEIESQVQAYLQQHPIRPWFNPLRPVESFVIKGVPWIEDLHRFPSSRLRIEFEGSDLDQETLYFYFRRYGLIRDIVPLSPASKDLPRYAIIQFVSIRGAVIARTCLHGIIAKNGTKLHIHYEPTIQKHIFRDWLFNHPRIVIPAVAALIAGLTVIVFDPIRTWFIKQKITKRFSLSDNAIIQWLRRTMMSTIDAISGRRFGLSKQVDSDLQIGFSDRRGIIEQLKTLLNETPETFIVVQGPRGSGKVELVRDHAVKGRPNTLFIDCEKITETRSDGAFIKEVSTQLGYFPVFPWMNNVSAFVDLIVQGIIGQKAGFSESAESQFKNILENAAAAIKEVAIDNHKKSMKSAAVNGAAYGDWYETNPGARPVVVIEHYLHRADRNESIYRALAEWASVLVMSRVAHVVFVTDDVGYAKVLQDAIPTQVLNTITVGDATPELARKFVLSQILAVTGESEEDVSESTLKDLDEAVKPLGGRMTDLLALVRRITMGENNKVAADDMIRQSASEIIKRFLRSGNDKSWTAEQAWIIVKSLAKDEDIRYNELLLNPLFKNAKDVIAALEHAELITVLDKDGRPYRIKAGRPIYRAACQRLLNDRGLAATLEISTLTALSSLLITSISKSEDELAKLSKIVAAKPIDISERMKYLAEDIRAKQAKISEYDKLIGTEKKVLATES
ncbi:RNA12 protein-domain-containing protein [Lipomyces kononenkoae]|uniref:RNA12 protein-domain-containing protein n=1 Tax=Lipomyces kononenkoae TaxID=34357 RepID=A0ACC3SZ29_LIPKO